ncbi:cystatin-A isoform X2 [Ursus maritimus]|uniref:Cystatin-A isoform X2 n=1 Tax=Ursus maritimus TaxID=29073 RepID=A0A384DH83_URSMA|nr:cystatin-A isoform X2 [Ursus maritimus]
MTRLAGHTHLFILSPHSPKFLLADSVEEAAWLASRHIHFPCAFLLFVKKKTFWRRGLLSNTLFKNQSLHAYLITSVPASCPAKKQLAKMIPGGLTEARPATPEIQEIANKHLSYHHVWQAGEGEGQLCSAQHLPMHHQVPDHHSQLASTLLAPIPGMSFSTKLPSEN